uniref:Mediator of RNA polymerase II transcription subunit 28 n=1 Tax=Xenopus tropicalis TaxID=8364 RepID=A0A1B8Y7I6_XENTR
MFSAQQPGPPPPIQPGAPAGLMSTPPGAKNPSSTLVDDLESSFEAYFASLVSQDYVNGVEQCIQTFLDVARQTECFLLQKKLQLSVQKPEQVLEEINGQHKKTSKMPQRPLAYLEQASANIPAPMKPT